MAACFFPSSHVPNMCGHSLSPLCLCLSAVKPTVVDVGIYVNSIGPVSSIDMVSSGRHGRGRPSADVSIARRDRGCSLGAWGGGLSCFSAEK